MLPDTRATVGKPGSYEAIAAVFGILIKIDIGGQVVHEIIFRGVLA